MTIIRAGADEHVFTFEHFLTGPFSLASAGDWQVAALARFFFNAPSVRALRGVLPGVGTPRRCCTVPNSACTIELLFANST
jgi:hypothetical protein